MNQNEGGPEGNEFVDQVFEGLDTGPIKAEAALKANFEPWHHPVKQAVRAVQWAALVRKLIDDEGPPPDGILRYLTLPGDDLFDVRVIAEASGNLTLRYLGFNNSAAGADIAPWAEAQAAVQQEGLADAQSVIVHDRIEDIALDGSNAAQTLAQQLHFDIINLDACSHLAYVNAGRTTSMFDALTRIVMHQLTARRPWLLFVTTRVSSGLIGEAPRAEFDSALNDNLNADPAFGVELQTAIGLGVGAAPPQLPDIWAADGPNLLKLFAISIGKHILRHIYAQPNFTAKVELASTLCYRVHSDDPDMVALAYRVTPRLRVFLPGEPVIAIPPEPQIAIGIARRSTRLYDLDDALKGDAEWQRESIEETEKLLALGNYDIAAYRTWLAGHQVRPVVEVG